MKTDIHQNGVELEAELQHYKELVNQLTADVIMLEEEKAILTHALAKSNNLR